MAEQNKPKLGSGIEFFLQLLSFFGLFMLMTSVSSLVLFGITGPKPTNLQAVTLAGFCFVASLYFIIHWWCIYLRKFK